MLIVFVAVTFAVQHRFLSSTNITFVLTNTTIFALLSLGETMVVITRNVDLSIGSGARPACPPTCHRTCSATHHGISILAVFAVGLAIGLACGLANGLIVSLGGVPSLVVTLATLYIVRGIDTLIVGGNEVVASTLPSSFIQIARANIGGVPYLAIGIAVLVGLGAYYLRSFRSGRELYAIGSSPDAARLAGIPVAKRICTAFVVSGAIAGIAGVLWATEYQTIDLRPHAEASIRASG